MIGPKQAAHRSPRWLRAVATLPCVLCGAHGTQAAHRNLGKALGLKTDDAWTAALCPPCHRDIDSGRELSREERRTLMDEAILLTLQQLARRGLIGPA